MGQNLCSKSIGNWTRFLVGPVWLFSSSAVALSSSVTESLLLPLPMVNRSCNLGGDSCFFVVAGSRYLS